MSAKTTSTRVYWQPWRSLLHSEFLVCKENKHLWLMAAMAITPAQRVDCMQRKQALVVIGSHGDHSCTTGSLSAKKTSTCGYWQPWRSLLHNGFHACMHRKQALVFICSHGTLSSMYANKQCNAVHNIVVIDHILNEITLQTKCPYLFSFLGSYLGNGSGSSSLRS